jgi:hypothetical protein
VFTGLADVNFVVLGVFSIPDCRYVHQTTEKRASRTTIDHIEALRFYVIWGYLGCQKDLPRSQQLLNIGVKAKFHCGLDINPVQNAVWTEQFE